MANKINRTIESVATVEKSKAQFNGWELNFTKNISEENKLTIIVYGKKGENKVNANIYDDGSTAVRFGNETDKTLTSAILDELEDMKPVEEEEEE